MFRAVVAIAVAVVAPDVFAAYGFAGASATTATLVNAGLAGVIGGAIATGTFRGAVTGGLSAIATVGVIAAASAAGDDVSEAIAASTTTPSEAAAATPPAGSAADTTLTPASASGAQAATNAGDLATGDPGVYERTLGYVSGNGCVDGPDCKILETDSEMFTKVGVTTLTVIMRPTLDVQTSPSMIPGLFENLRGAIQVGIGGSVGSLVQFPGGVGIAADAHLNIGVYGYTGIGGQVGSSAEGGISVQASNAKYLSDLAGPFSNGSLHAGAGVGGSLDYFTGPSANAQVYGLGFTAGSAAGASASTGVTYTFICILGQGCGP